MLPLIALGLGHPRGRGVRQRHSDGGAGLTQARFARKVRVDPCTVSSWETGATAPPGPYMTRILAALGAAGAQILNGRVSQ